MMSSTAPARGDSSQTRDSSGAATTSSRVTRVLGAISLVGLAVLGVFAFVLTEADLVQQDVVRLLYVHAPTAIVSYVAFTITAFASAMVLWKRSTWWDIAAAASAELGVLFCGLMLTTGIIWGRPTWGTWWQWGDVRLMTSLMMLLVYIGYLAFRRAIPVAEVRARRSAIIGIVGVLNVAIVNRSVEWWASRTLHQKSSVAEGNMEDLTLFTLMMGLVVFGMIFAWLLIHRFRIGWLEHQTETVGLQIAMAERRSQLLADVDDSVAHPALGSSPGTAAAGSVELEDRR